MTENEKSFLIEKVCKIVLKKVKGKSPERTLKLKRLDEIADAKKLSIRMKEHIGKNLLELY